MKNKIGIVRYKVAIKYEITIERYIDAITRNKVTVMRYKVK